MLKKFGFIVITFIPLSLFAAKEPELTLRYQSSFLRLELAPDQPALTGLAVDSLGKNKLGENSLRAPGAASRKYESRLSGTKVEYRPQGEPNAQPVWSFEFSERQIHIHSAYSSTSPPAPLELNFNTFVNHATLLGLLNEDSSVRLPALLHLPDQGTFRITASAPNGLALGYDAQRFFTWDNQLNYKEGDQAYVKVTFPPATAVLPQLDYTLDVVAIYPSVPGIENDPRFDGFRRNWLNIFQLSPRRRALANHAASDACSFTVYLYTSMAERTPPLAPGLTAMDMVRQTLDQYLSGAHGYGMASPNNPENPAPSVDTFPSLLIASGDYVNASGDEAWLKKNYGGIKSWATQMLAMDPDGSGLLKDISNGNSGIWDYRQYPRHTSNWWDNIGFGHLDAYGNALAYQALLKMAEMARRAGQPGDARLYQERAEKLKSVYFDTFYNPATGVLAGWRSADGKLHDYYFTFVNGAAITYGLIPRDKANLIMDRMLVKMKEVGYTRFDYGLPGNLIPIRQEDYMVHNARWGGPQKKDGSDTFGIYCNGGASGCFVYFTLQALYQLGRREEADAMLFPLLRAYEEGGFQGHGDNGMTYDWKEWNGTPHGYEGLLVDSYQALLAVLSR
ncbi:MAG: hypothetical protein U0V70_05150 [Terriglobia bacterium]